MSYIQPKNDYKDGDILYGIDLNASNDVIKAGVDDNFDRIQGLETSKQNVLTAGTGIEITEENVINNTQTSAEWGNIQGDIEDQTDLQTALGTKVDKVEGKGLSTNDYDNTAKGIVDNVTTNLAGKVDKVEGKGLSTEDYTTVEKTKLSGIESGAEANVNADWSASSGDAEILNKPTSISGYGITDAYTKTEVDNALGNKVDKVTGKQLSTEDYTSAEKSKLANMDADAEANIIEIVKVDGTALTPDANKAVNVDLSGKQEVLVSGTNIKTINDQSILGSGNITIGGGGGGTSNYNDLENKPQINSVTLTGNKSLSDLGITIPTKLSDLTNDNNTVTDANYVHTDNNYTSTEKTKLAGIEAGAEVNDIDTIKVNGTSQTITSKTVDITVPTKTSDLNNDSNFVSDSSYVHTDNNYTSTEKTKLAGIEAGAQVNVEEITVGSTPTTDTTLIIDEYDLVPNSGTEITNEYSNSTTLGYSCAYINNNSTGGGEALPVGTEVDFDGSVSDIPIGWEQITNPNVYSTSEIKTNEIWTNGKPIYRKVYEISLSNNSNISQAHNLTNIGFWTINLSKSCVLKPGTESLPANWYYSSSDYARTWITAQNIRFVSPGSLNGYTLYAVVEYTKTTD